MKHAVLATAIAVALAGCASMGGGGPGATSQLTPTRGNTAAGTVTFSQRRDKAVITANLT